MHGATLQAGCTQTWSASCVSNRVIAAAFGDAARWALPAGFTELLDALPVTKQLATLPAASFKTIHCPPSGQAYLHQARCCCLPCILRHAFDTAAPLYAAGSKTSRLSSAPALNRAAQRSRRYVAFLGHNIDTMQRRASEMSSSVLLSWGVQ